VIELFPRYAVTGVGNRHLHASALPVVTRGNGNRPSLVHRLNRIHEDVHEDLLELGLVRHHRGQAGVQVADDVDVEEQRLFRQQRQRVLQDFVEVDSLRVGLRLPRNSSSPLTMSRQRSVWRITSSATPGSDRPSSCLPP